MGTGISQSEHDKHHCCHGFYSLVGESDDKQNIVRWHHLSMDKNKAEEEGSRPLVLGADKYLAAHDICRKERTLSTLANVGPKSTMSDPEKAGSTDWTRGRCRCFIKGILCCPEAVKLNLAP